MSNCVVYFPPKHRSLDIDYTNERILLPGSSVVWKKQFVSAFSEHPVEFFNSLDDRTWEIEHSFISTLIPLYFNESSDATSLVLLGKHGNVGKLIVCCTDKFPLHNVVKSVCTAEGTTLVTTIEDLIDISLARLDYPRKYRNLLASSD